MTSHRGFGTPGGKEVSAGDNHRYAMWDAAYVLGSLSATERREFEAHLADCPPCREAVAQLSGLPALLSRLDRHEVAAMHQSDHTSERGADEPVAHDVQGFEVIAGVDLMPFEARLVAADDVQVQIPDADFMQIGRHLIGRCNVGSEKINTFHGFPPTFFDGGQ